MKSKIMSLFLLLIVSCNSQNHKSKKLEINNSVDSLTVNQIKAFYFINKLDKLGVSFSEMDTVNPMDLDEIFESKIKSTPNSFTYKINKNIKIFKLKNKINNWIKVKEKIDNAIDKSENVDYLEFFYKNTKTSFLFDKYLTDRNIQDWSSLSSSDSYNVYYDIITIVNDLKIQNQQVIISSFYKFMFVKE